MKNRLFFLPIIAWLLCAACSKEITIDTGEFIERPVIEGYIENDATAWVFITKNQAFFEPMNLDFNDISSVSKFFITDAVVVVSDGQTIDTLQFGVNPGILQGTYVWPPVRYQGSKIIGEVGKSYHLTVKIGDNTYTATTTITTPIIPDSLWFVSDESVDSMGYIHTIIHDDPSQVNYYRYFAKRHGKDSYFVAGAFSLWEDSFFNGKAFEVIVMRGQGYEAYNPDYEVEPEAMLFFDYGDTVTVKTVTMDRNSFLFWRTLNGNQTETNILGGALGVWCGYGVYYCPPVVCLP